MNKNKLGRGYKKCKKCGEVNGVRTAKCKKCSEKFKIEKGVKVARKHKFKKVNWQELEPGDKIRVYNTGSSYFENEGGGYSNINRGGYYTVKSLTPDGIKCFSEKGFCFIYMGEPCVNSAGIYNEAHKIKKVITLRG